MLGDLTLREIVVVLRRQLIVRGPNLLYFLLRRFPARLNRGFVPEFFECHARFFILVHDRTREMLDAAMFLLVDYCVVVETLDGVFAARRQWLLIGELDR